MSYLALSTPIVSTNIASEQSWKFFENCDYYLLDVSTNEVLRSRGLLDADNKVKGKPTLIVRDYYVAYYKSFAEQAFIDNIIIRNWIGANIPKGQEVVFINHYVMTTMYSWYSRQEDLKVQSASLANEMIPQIKP